MKDDIKNNKMESFSSYLSAGNWLQFEEKLINHHILIQTIVFKYSNKSR